MKVCKLRVRYAMTDFLHHFENLLRCSHEWKCYQMIKQYNVLKKVYRWELHTKKFKPDWHIGLNSVR